MGARKAPGTAMAGRAARCVQVTSAHSQPRRAASFRTRAASCPTAPPAAKGPTPNGAPWVAPVGTMAHRTGTPRLILPCSHGSPCHATGLTPTRLPPRSRAGVGIPTHSPTMGVLGWVPENRTEPGVPGAAARRQSQWAHGGRCRELGAVMGGGGGG